MNDKKKKSKRSSVELKALAKKNSTSGKAHVHPLAAAQVGTDVVGNEEFEDLEKRDYGFDWETRKGLHPDQYSPGG